MLLGVRLRLLELDIPGARLVPAGLIPSYRAERTLAAAGPAASLILALLTLGEGTAFAIAVRTTTLSLALFNLLPIRDFDGGRILHATLCPLTCERVSTYVLHVSTYCCLLTLFSFSACLLLRFGENIMLALLSASLFARLFLLEEH